MKAGQLSLHAFLTIIVGESVVFMSDSATVVAYVKKQGGTVSRAVQASPRYEVDGDVHGLCFDKLYPRKIILVD